VPRERWGLTVIPQPSQHAPVRHYAAVASRSRARMTVIADQGSPVGVATLRLFRMRAISRADLSASSSNTGAGALAAPRG
jgi:hypothetical protein